MVTAALRADKYRLVFCFNISCGKVEARLLDEIRHLPERETVLPECLLRNIDMDLGTSDSEQLDERDLWKV